MMHIYNQCKANTTYKHHRSLAFFKVLIGKELIKQNKFEDALLFIKKGIESLESEYQKGNPRRDLAYANIALGDLYYAQKKYYLAKQFYENAYKIYTQTLTHSNNIYEVKILFFKMINTYINLQDEFSAKGYLVKFKTIFEEKDNASMKLNKILSDFTPCDNRDNIIHKLFNIVSN